MHPDVALVNPLGAALHHYEASTRSILEACGASVESWAVDEPSASGNSSAQWLADYARAAKQARRSRPIRLLSLWPAVGYLDFPFLRSLAVTRPTIVVHDPHPLVSAKGYGRVARQLAGLAAMNAEAIVHSAAAEAIVRRETRIRRVSALAHPTTPHLQSERQPDVERRPTVRVLGQYKADRDIAALMEISERVPPGVELQIVGRGWPEVQGWTLRDEFVPEAEFASLIASSAAVVVPYRRFFQSGIAIRCLEQGVPVVGPSASSLEDLLGQGHAWLASPGGWSAALHAALRSSNNAVYDLHARYRALAIAEWSEWFETPTGV